MQALAYLDFLGKSGGEHEGLAVVGHVLLLYDAANLRFEAHIQHSVGLIQH